MIIKLATQNTPVNTQRVTQPVAANAGPIVCPASVGSVVVANNTSAQSATAISFHIEPAVYTTGIADCVAVAVYCNRGTTLAGGMVHFTADQITNAAAYNTIISLIPAADRPHSYAVIATSSMWGAWFANTKFTSDIEPILTGLGIPANRIIFYHDRRRSSTSLCLRSDGRFGSLD